MFRRLSERDIGFRYRRSPATLGEICRLAECSPTALNEVIELFAHPEASFLERRGMDSDDPLIDVSHESLIRRWQKLRAWVDDEAERVRVFRRVASDAETWDEKGRTRELLRTGGYLDLMVRNWQKYRPTKAWSQRYSLSEGGGGQLSDIFDIVDDFRAESVRAEDNRRNAAETAQQAAEAARVAAITAKERARRNRIIAALATALVIVIGGATVRLYEQRTIAEAQTKLAEQRRTDLVEAQARVVALRGDEALRRDGASTALLIALELLKGTNELPYVPEVEDLAYRSLYRLHEARILSFEGARVSSVDYSPKNGTLMAAGPGGKIHVWDLKTGAERLISIPGVTDFIWNAKWSPDGERILLSTPSATAIVPANSDDPASALTLGTPGTPAGFGIFSPDGERVATSNWAMSGGSTSIKLWNATTGKLEKEFGKGGRFGFSLAYSADARRLAAADEAAGVVHIFDAESGTETSSFALDEKAQSGGMRHQLSFHPKNPDWLLSAGPDRTLKLWDISSGGILRKFEGRTGLIRQAVFSPAGDLIAASSEDGTVQIWPVKDDGRPSTVVRGHRGNVMAIRFSPDGQSIATGAADGTVRIWNVQAALHPDIEISASVRQGPAVPAVAGSAPGIRGDVKPTEAFGSEDVGSSVRPLSVINASGKPIELSLPSGFAEREWDVSRPWVAVAPASSEGRPLLFNLDHLKPDHPSAHVATLGVDSARWRSIGFGPDRDAVTGTTKEGARYTWRYFRDRAALVSFAEEHLPLRDGMRVQLTDRQRCAYRLVTKPCTEIETATTGSPD
jgi:WD40 repeat protein